MTSLVFLGPPGSGKGTSSRLLCTRMGIIHISPGDIFRDNIKHKTSLGLQVSSILDEGGYVPDDLTNELMRTRLAEDDVKNGYVLDGYPRTIPQASALNSFSNLSCVIDFVISEDLLIERLSGRLLCQNCSQSYHVKKIPSKKRGICDTCGGVLITRKDDQIDSIRKRLEVYTKSTTPLKQFYQEMKLLVSLDADRSPEEVLENILGILKVETQ